MTTNRTYDPGQRVDVLSHDNQTIPGVHTVVDATRWGLDETRFVRVRRVIDGEIACDDWPIDRIRPRR